LKELDRLIQYGCQAFTVAGPAVWNKPDLQ